MSFIDCAHARNRKEGAGEIYIYMPSNPENQGLMNLNGSEPDPGIYGFSIARGAFSFTRGGWTVVTQRVQLNKYGVADGMYSLDSQVVSLTLSVRGRRTRALGKWGVSHSCHGSRAAREPCHPSQRNPSTDVLRWRK